MEKNIQIKEVNVIKEGQTNGRDWVIYKVLCEGDEEMQEFSTFNNYTDKIGQTMKLNFQFDEKYKNWKEISETQAKELDKHEQILGALRNIYEKVEGIATKIDK